MRLGEPRPGAPPARAQARLADWRWRGPRSDLCGSERFFGDSLATGENPGQSLKDFARAAPMSLPLGLPSPGMRRGIEVTENDIATIW